MQNSIAAFNALDGQESAKLIGHSFQQALIGKSFKKKLAISISQEFLRQLASHSDFQPHLTYRSFRWEIKFLYQVGTAPLAECYWKMTLKFEWSTQDIEDFGVEGVRVYTISTPLVGIPLAEVPWQSLEHKGSSSRAPDRDRDQLNVKKPKATQTSGGIVDWPVK